MQCLCMCATCFNTTLTIKNDRPKVSSLSELF